MSTLRDRLTSLRPPSAGPLRRLVASEHRWLGIAAVALAVGTAPAFLRTFVTDDATYVLIAQKLNAGALLYRQAVDNKPPLIYITFAAVLRMFGANALGAMKLLAIVAQLISALMVAALDRRLFDTRTGVVGALMFCLAAVSGLAHDVAAPNTEIFANPFILSALLLLARDLERSSRRALLTAGLFIGVASLYRLPSAAALLGVLLFLVQGPLSRRERLRAAFHLTAGFALPLAVAGAYFSLRGTASDAWLWAVRGNLSYVGVGEAQVGSLALGRLALLAAAQFPLLIVGTRVAVLWSSTREPHRARLRFVLLQLLTALLAYRTGSRFYGHYFLQVVPFLALVGGWGFLHLPRRDRRWLRFLPAAMILVLLAFAVVNTVRAQTGPEAGGLMATVATIQAETGPNDEVLLWSAPAEIAFESRRRFATRFPFNNYLTGRIFGTRYVLPGTTRVDTYPFENPQGWLLLARDLAVAPPAFIVDGDGGEFAIDKYPALAPFLRTHYGAPRRLGTFTVYRRRPEQTAF